MIDEKLMLISASSGLRVDRSATRLICSVNTERLPALEARRGVASKYAVSRLPVTL